MMIVMVMVLKSLSSPHAARQLCRRRHAAHRSSTFLSPPLYRGMELSSPHHPSDGETLFCRRRNGVAVFCRRRNSVVLFCRRRSVPFSPASVERGHRGQVPPFSKTLQQNEGFISLHFSTHCQIRYKGFPWALFKS